MRVHLVVPYTPLRRKILRHHEIVTVQTTAIDEAAQVNFTLRSGAMALIWISPAGTARRKELWRDSRLALRYLAFSISAREAHHLGAWGTAQ